MTSRRAGIRPEQVALPPYHGRRRIPGLRREEVALLAGISVDYYTRLERGNLTAVSETVLDAVAKVRRLDDAVAILLTAAGKDPDDPQLTQLVGELSTRSEEFRVRGGSHNVRQYRSGHKRINLPDRRNT